MILPQWNRFWFEIFHISTTTNSNCRPFTFWTILIITFISEINSIRINRFQVPEAVERGRPAVIQCEHSLDVNEELYSIKLYKNNIEFYRYVPRENPMKQSYKLAGIYVNLEASNASHVVLSQTNLNSDGLYICEISTEGPIFSTVRSEQLMKIYVLPDQKVQIHGILDQYNYGDNISLVCKAGKSWPPLKLEWTINDNPVDLKFVTYMSNERSPSSPLVTTRIGLNIYAKPKYFRNGILEIKCIASLIIVYEYDTSIHLITGSFKSNKYKNDWSLQPNVRRPVISGMRKNYRLDENLHLNCTSRHPNALLKWFVNTEPASENDIIRYDRENILGLWIRMDKRLIQMPELIFRCAAYYYKNIRQFHTLLTIRNYDNRSWQTLSSGTDSDPYSIYSFWLLLFSSIFLIIQNSMYL